MNVIKRDGRSVKFDENKIRKAITSAFNSCKETVTEDDLQKLINFVTDKLEGKDCASVEEIQNFVEAALMYDNHYTVASHYILYRDERTKEREKNSAIMKLRQAKLQGKDISNQNANVDERSFGGRKGEADAVLLKEDALNYYMSANHAKNHRKNRIYIHDLDSYILGMHNCLSIPFDKLLRNGFTSRQTDIRSVGSVSTAFQLVAVIFQLQSLQQFGGVSATHLDWTMVPYVRKSFYKHYTEELKYHQPKKYKKFVDKFMKKISDKISIEDKKVYTDRSARDIAMALTKEELEQAVEGMYHNLNTLQSRSGNQLPFTSINYGTCTLPEGQMVIEALLDGSINGVGRLHRTAIFPCGIFQYKKGVNDKEGTPNYYLFKKALQSTAKRLYPNYVNCDWSNDSDYNDIKFKEKYLADLSGEELKSLIEAIEGNPELSHAFGLNVKEDETGKFVEIDDNIVEAIPSTMGCLDGKEHLYVKIDEKVYDISIKDFFEYGKTGELKNARPAQIYFSKERLNIEGNKHIQEKSNITPGAGVYSITYTPDDVTYIGSSSDVCRRWAEHKCSIKTSGGLDSGVCFGDANVDNYVFKVLEYTEDYKNAEKKYIERNETVNYKGTAQRYYKVVHASENITDRPSWKLDKSIPQELYTFDNDVKVLDMNGDWTRVRHVFKNDKWNSPYMMHIYYKEDDATFCISATEDHPFYTPDGFMKAADLKPGCILYRADGKELPVTSVSYHWERTDSYDIGTESGTFIGSDIKMHNCRTYTSKDVAWEDDWTSDLRSVIEDKNFKPSCFASSHVKDGRGNVCPATIILPTLAMEAKKKGNTEEEVVEAFMNILDKAIYECRDELLERFDWICAQSPSSADFMYENGTFYGYRPEEGIRSALRHGSLAVGQLGLAECLQILVGCNHTTDKGMALAKRIEGLFKQRCAEFKQEYHAMPVTEKQVLNSMLIKAKKNKGRDLTEDEVKQITNYCSKKFAELTPEQKISKRDTSAPKEPEDEND